MNMVIAGFLLKTWMLGVGDPEVVWAETLTQTKYFTHDQNKKLNTLLTNALL